MIRLGEVKQGSNITKNKKSKWAWITAYERCVEISCMVHRVVAIVTTLNIAIWCTFEWVADMWLVNWRNLYIKASNTVNVSESPLLALMQCE